MDASLIISLLCVGWLLMLWVLKAGLDHVESTLAVDELQSASQTRQPGVPRFDRPDAMGDIIGGYMGAPIYQAITIGGIDYCFDHIQPRDATFSPGPDECFIEPGLVYAVTLKIAAPK